MRDEKIPIISFVANTGGLIGLCMGFSLVSAFEIMYHCGGAIKKKWTSSQKVVKLTTENSIETKCLCADQRQHNTDNLLNHDNDCKEAIQITPKSSMASKCQVKDKHGKKIEIAPLGKY